MGFFDRILEWLRSIFFNQELEISLVGLPRSGKSTFVQVVSGGTFTDDQMPTVGFEVSRYNRGGVSFKFWDIGGQYRFRKSWERFCKGTDIIIFMIDSADPYNFPNAKEEINNLLSKESLAGISLLILANKNDLKEHVPLKKIVSELELDSIQDRTVAYYSISCQNQTNIDEVLRYLSSNAR
eukprot:TRINITY_DN3210_c0_g2_i1.p1 TRINITY_DN3210_c0_g2~~TRINITY_DN3210_c0_g2_i1.p1  ORF type:complete len:190 (+),score=38.67 TRINITY_DN3210_c0_g2_i1:27-572(+)